MVVDKAEVKQQQTEGTSKKLRLMQRVRIFLGARQEEFHFGHMLLFVYITAVIMVALGSYLFYHDSRSKYDISRPGRTLMNFSPSLVDDIGPKLDKMDANSIKLELEALRKQQMDIGSYGSYEAEKLNNSVLLPN